MELLSWTMLYSSDEDYIKYTGEIYPDVPSHILFEARKVVRKIFKDNFVCSDIKIYEETSFVKDWPIQKYVMIYKAKSDIKHFHFLLV